jgi:DNA-binding NtrC family response regulator
VEIGEDRLRRDLAAWLAPYLVHVPPLRQRQEDLEDLAAVFARRYTGDGNTPPSLHPEVLALLQRYGWPGNANELEEEIRSLLTHSVQDGVVVADGVSARIRESTGYGSGALSRALRDARGLKQAVELVERELIREGLIRTGWNKSLLARQLGISRSNLLAKVERYELDKLRSLED